MSRILKQRFVFLFPLPAVYAWKPGAVDLGAVSGALIAAGCYAIAILLLRVAHKRRGLATQRAFVFCLIFLLACGTLHLLSAWGETRATRAYELAGAITALASLATAISLAPLLRDLIRLPAPGQLEKVSRFLATEFPDRDEATKVLLEQAGLLDLAHDAIIVRRPDGTVVFWNRGAELMYGWTKQEALGRHTSELLATRFPGTLEKVLRQVEELGNWEGELVHTKRDGTQVTVSSRWARRKTPRGGIEILEINTDISRQKAAEERLRELNLQLEQRVARRTAELSASYEYLRAETARGRALEEQLLHSQKMEAIGRLAGGVAHDFNNLLTIIAGYGRLLQEELPLQSPLRERVAHLLNAADRAAALVNQLLTFSRRQIVQPRLLNLNTILENAGKMWRRVVGEDIQFSTELAPDLGSIRADAGQIEQVLLNLIVNAKDAMPQGGRITIATANADFAAGAPETLPSLQAGSYIMLTVADTGLGMDAATQSRIFEPFFTTKGPGKGTGLGLSTVYGIVKQNGGEVGVDSEPGRGTTIRVYLPRCSETPEASPPAEPAAAVAHGVETILLVEDEDDVRVLARDILTRHGYNVVECASGEAAIECFASRRGDIDLVLTDIVMPGMSGTTLAEKLREVFPAVKVLFMTGYHGHDLPDKEPGYAARLLTKPFTPQTLALKVREQLDTSTPATVLVVDDETEIRTVVRKTLEDRGYRVREAAGWQEALTQLAVAPVDIMLTDVLMSNDTAEPLRNLLPQYPDLKVILMSGAAESKLAEAAARIAAHAVLPKPVQGEQLLAVLQRLLGKAT